MKSGTITKIILECCFVLALPNHLNNITTSLLDALSKYEQSYRDTYLCLNQISPIVEVAGDTLKSGGHIYYIAEDSTFGILGFIDASEQQPVFNNIILK
jgi:N-acetylmuramic acid 6-phosphate (MurNAc-6-P) etherase